MTTLSKEDVSRMAKEAFACLFTPLPVSESGLQAFATLARADLLAENERLREQIKCGHSMELDALARERDELLVENGLLENKVLAREAELWGETQEILAIYDQLAAAQAKIDSLMLEYCPDEMTPEQIDNWGKHQKAVSDQTNLPLQLSP